MNREFKKSKSLSGTNNYFKHAIHEMFLFIYFFWNNITYYNSSKYLWSRKLVLKSYFILYVLLNLYIFWIGIIIPFESNRLFYTIDTFIYQFTILSHITLFSFNHISFFILHQSNVLFCDVWKIATLYYLHLLLSVKATVHN